MHVQVKKCDRRRSLQRAAENEEFKEPWSGFNPSRPIKTLEKAHCKGHPAHNKFVNRTKQVSRPVENWKSNSNPEARRKSPLPEGVQTCESSFSSVPFG